MSRLEHQRPYGEQGSGKKASRRTPALFAVSFCSAQDFVGLSLLFGVLGSKFSCFPGSGFRFRVELSMCRLRFLAVGVYELGEV